MNEQKRHVLAVQEPPRCYSCGGFREHQSSVRVVSIELLQKSGWKLSGKGQTNVSCPRCNAIFEAIRAAIPIECESFVCPNCGDSAHLQYKVHKIDAQETAFSFEAEIACEKCQRKSILTKILQDLFGIKKIEIKLTGISVER